MPGPCAFSSEFPLGCCRAVAESLMQAANAVCRSANAVCRYQAIDAIGCCMGFVMMVPGRRTQLRPGDSSLSLENHSRSSNIKQILLVVLYTPSSSTPNTEAPPDLVVDRFARKGNVDIPRPPSSMDKTKQCPPPRGFVVDSSPPLFWRWSTDRPWKRQERGRKTGY